MICGARLGSITAGALACGAIGAGAGFAAWTAADCWAGRIVFGTGAEGVRLATDGIEAGGRGRLPTGPTGGGPTGPYLVVKASPRLSPMRYAGMKRIIRPLRASITSRPSSPPRSITATV